MERNQFCTHAPIEEGGEKILNLFEGEDYKKEIERLSSLTLKFEESKEKKMRLKSRLDSLIQVKSDSLRRMNTLHEMQEKVDGKKEAMENMLAQSTVASESIKRKEEKLGADIKSLLVTGTTLSAARTRLQELNQLLGGDSGYSRLRTVSIKLRRRQQFMISQVSLLYSVKVYVRPSGEQELESFPGSDRSLKVSGSKLISNSSLAILGLHLSLAPFTKHGIVTDQKEAITSATALGYTAHAVSLIASYLNVPLRYCIRLNSSHSYIIDHSAPVELTTPSSSTWACPRTCATEFPLFLDDQDTTRAAYAIFLLNKDLEQLLNYIGASSLGPRHVLPNLKELFRTVLSDAFLFTI